MDVKKSREYFLDLLRVLACFLVIVNHTNSTIFLNGTPENKSWFLSLAYFFISKIAVPIFFMISGYLLLSRVDSWKKALTRFFRIAVVLLGCSVVYSVYYNIFVDSNTSVIALVKRMLSVYKYSPSNALWYLYAYLGILLMLPFLQKMALLMTKRDYQIFISISLLFSAIMPVLKHYSDIFFYNSSFYIPLFSGYICFLFIGQYFAKFGIKKTKFGFFLALFVFILMVGLNVVLTLLEYNKSSSSYLFFDNVTYFPIVLESVCVFYMATFAKLGDKISSVISYIGASTFGIYLISDMSIGALKPFYNTLSGVIHPLIAVLIFEVIVFIVGFVITVVLRKIPFVKKFL